MVLAPKSTNTKIHAFFPSSQPSNKTRQSPSQRKRRLFSTQIETQTQGQSPFQGSHCYNELQRLSRLPFISSSQDIDNNNNNNDDDDDDFQPSPLRRLQRQRSSENGKEKGKAKTKAKAKPVASSSSVSSSTQGSTSSAKRKTPPRRTGTRSPIDTQSTPRSPVVKKEKEANLSEVEQFVFEDLSSMIKKERGSQQQEDDITIEFDDITDLIKKEKGVQPKKEDDFTFDLDDLSSLIKKERRHAQPDNASREDETIEFDDLSSLIKEEKQGSRTQPQDNTGDIALLDDLLSRPSLVSNANRSEQPSPPQIFTPTPSPPPAQRRRLSSPISLTDSPEQPPRRARRASLVQRRRSPPRFPGPDVRPQIPHSRREQNRIQRQQSTLDTLIIPRNARNTQARERGNEETTACPLCQQNFPASEIEAHASDCKGLDIPVTSRSSAASINEAAAPEECPICGEYIAVDELERHVNEELEANERTASSEAGPSRTSYQGSSHSIPDMSQTDDVASDIESDSDCSLLDLTTEQSQSNRLDEHGFPTPSASADEPETVELSDDGHADDTATMDGFESILGQQDNPELQTYFNQLDPERRNARSARGRRSATTSGVPSSSRSSNQSRSSWSGHNRGGSSRYNPYARKKWYGKKKKASSRTASNSRAKASSSRSSGSSSNGKGSGKGKGKGK
ncbi:hypothetical protein BCR43DRAFT_493084 [Syncephalastrum racemosum]|uniref:UBZ4-type domain-containing protein n=1 Tax=Syncephalastrum racemosum TaxID=13706 RepID=A0A1X2HA02_SYNRA|nr:hypothetical protein BCR43DRAFT_493084 [Syncephalastrum racemosum]